MDKDKFEHFVEYYRTYCMQNKGLCEGLTYVYEKFGREFIHSLPVELKTDPFNGEKYTVVQGTYWMHSTTGLACYCHGEPEFYILGYWLPLDQWLPYSALSSEEQLLCKLKYG